MAATDFSDEARVEQYDEQPLSHGFVVYPAIRDVLGDMGGATVLDVGCGGGVLAAELAGEADLVWGVDVSEAWIRRARDRFSDVENLSFAVEDAADLSRFEDDVFDVVVMNMVAINIDSENTLASMFSEVARVLCDDGRFVFTDIHPCSVVCEETVTDRHSHPDSFSYFDNGCTFHSSVLMGDGSRMSFDDVHWTMQRCTELLHDNGLCLTHLVEPEPVTGAPSVFDDYPVPEYLVYEAVSLESPR